MKINPATDQGYDALASLAMFTLSEDSLPFIDKSMNRSYFCIVVAGKNVGFGSSREPTPIALGSSCIKAFIVESFPRIFFRNGISTGEILPVEVSLNLSQSLQADDILTIIPSQN